MGFPSRGASELAAEHLHELYATGWLVERVAAHLETTPARIRRRLMNRTLLQLPDQEVLYAFQFTARGVVPGWAHVAGVMPLDLTPLEIVGFVTTPQSDLGRATPLEWLLAGKPSRQVALIAAQLRDEGH